AQRLLQTFVHRRLDIGFQAEYLGHTLSVANPVQSANFVNSGKIILVMRIDTRYTLFVIVSFRHKGLEALYRDNSKRGILPSHAAKLSRILAVLDVAQVPEDLAIPSFRSHELKGDLAGHWSIWVNGNWRVPFRFIGQDVELVDYQDYH
ncbi:MAG: type II toxin-antitoxin system RelE/ParE family toxin, partial [Microbacteriaceae bacterium]